MIKVPGFAIKQFLSKTDFSVIYRAESEADRTAVILKLLRAELPCPEDLTLFRHEYNILTESRAEGVPLAISLQKHGHGYVLIMRDSGGTSLDLLFKDQALDLKTFFEIAIPCLKILGRIHAHNFIHCDLKTNNITFNPENRVVEIIDFGLAIPFSARHGQAPRMAGTLNYMAPEQTGRMNRSIDHRSDLYSLGVTFYELLTGQLPFQGKDILEIVHAHIAVTPKSVDTLRPDIPAILSRIIQKLMAKDAEERYQSAAGAAHDLEICYKQFLADSMITDFELGTHDHTEKFIIPDKVYGRGKDVEVLKNALRAAQAGENLFITIDGPPGIGKSAIVGELMPLVVAAKGVLLVGKFDQYNSNIPFFAFIQGINRYIKEVLSVSDLEVTTLKNRILGALGVNAGVLTAFIPSLETIIGPQAKVEHLGPKESSDRLMDATLRLLRVLGRPESPLVIFLDDLQWSEAASRALIKTICTDKSFKNILLIGAFRGNEVNEVHPLSFLFKELHALGTLHQQLTLGPLTVESIQQLVFDTLKVTSGPAEELSQLIFDRTGGNAFFVRQFFASLHDKGLLKYDGQWSWNIQDIRALPATNNVLDILIPKIHALSELARQILCAGSCAGNEFDLSEVSSLIDCPMDQALTQVKELVMSGLLADKGDARFRFVHDRIQEAAYGVLSAEERRGIHYKLGQIFLQIFERDGDDIYRVVHHLNKSSDLITQQQDLIRLIKLNSSAAQKARDTASFEAVIEYTTRGLDYLEKNGLMNNEELFFSLKVLHSEADFMMGNRDRSKAELSKIVNHLSSKERKMRAHLTLANLLNSEMDYAGSYYPCVAGLKLAGVWIPKFIGPLVPFELVRLLIKLAFTSEKKIMSLPQSKSSLTDELMGAAMLMSVTTKKQLYLYINLCAARRMFKYGYSHCSAPILMTISAICAAILSLPKLARKLTPPALYFDSKFPGSQFTGAADLFYGSFVLVWLEDVGMALESIKLGLAKMVDSGFRSMLTANGPNIIIGYRTFSGENLLQILPDIDAYQKSVLKSDPAYFPVECFRSVILCLNGKTKDPFSFSTDDYDLEAEQIKCSPVEQGRYAMLKLIPAYTLDQVDRAIPLFEAAKVYTRVSTPFSYGLALHCTYYSLCLCVYMTTAARRDKKSALREVRKNLRKLRRWTKVNPHAFQPQYDLVSGALAQSLGDIDGALRLLTSAALTASVAGYSHVEGHANELLGQIYLSQGHKKLALYHLTEAVKLFEHWGAMAKVDLLRKKYPDLQESTFSPSTLGQTTTNMTLNSNNTQHSRRGSAPSFLDLASIMKSSGALAQEIEMDKLIKTLILTMLENAGAQRVILIINKDDILTVVAEGSVQGNNDVFLVEKPLTDFEGISKTITSYVLRSSEAVVLPEAVKDPIFGQDPYVIQNNVKSVLCVPVMNKGKVSGVIYFENNASAFVFTPDRVETLKILVSQAAISLENARLFEQAGVKARMEAELETAKTVQETLFPAGIAQLDCVSIAGDYEPATECGGDLWFYNELEKKVFVWLGDATGHGAPAALVTSSARSAISVMREISGIDPAAALRILNNSIYDCSKNRINMSFFVLSLDPATDTLCYANAGQTSPIHIPKKVLDDLRCSDLSDMEKFRQFRKDCRFLPSKASHLLGGSLDQTYQTNSVSLAAGDLLILYSDGITELLNAENKMWGERLMLKSIMSAVLRTSDPTEIRAAIKDDMLRFRSGAELADDTTLVVVRYKS